MALIYAAFAKHEIHPSHDEAEHLHVVFALERGERPYRDFIENHPLLPHVLLSGLSRGLGLSSGSDLYLLAKVAVLAHFLGCLLLLFSWLSRYRDELGLQLSPVLTFPLVAALLGVWQSSAELTGRFAFLWEVRPDWICHFWTLAALLLAVESLRSRSTAPARALSVLGGLCAGFALALMAKSVLLLLPAALALMLTAVRWGRVHPDGVRLLLRALGLAGCFLLAAVVAFTVGVGGELAAAGATFDEYWTANISLNAQKHLVQLTEDLAPANVLRGISGLGFPAAVIATVLGFALTGHARRKESWLRYGVFAFAGIQLLFSMFLPAFSNGLSWPQYFMPALLVMLLVFVLMLDALAAALFGVHVAPLWQPGRARSHCRATSPRTSTAWSAGRPRGASSRGRMTS
ncbi:MAG: hypothetical protein EOP35_21135 [Rubrivivax sp.]|nr:MAG: hypothetical protein EOP35_21135 [Rubrivivax sp.]